MTWILALVVGCSDATQPVERMRYSPPPPAPPYPGPGPTTPSASAKAVIYDGPMSPFDAYHNGSLSSRYVLYDDGVFVLEFVSARFGPFSYAGRYTRADSHFVFDWDGTSTAGPWGSEATLRGDSLKVTYNWVMQASDFSDATYIRSPSTP